MYIRIAIIFLLFIGCESTSETTTNDVQYQEQDQGINALFESEDAELPIQNIEDMSLTVQEQDLSNWQNPTLDMLSDPSIMDMTIERDANDQDGDGIPNTQDNCPQVANPLQHDFDENGVGDFCEDDQDGDGIPDAWDPEPNDATWPGRALPDTVYAHTSDALYSLDIKSTRPTLIAPFTFENEPQFITDIAINKAGVLWAISFTTIYICHAQEAYCKPQGILPNEQLNGLTFIDGEVYDQPQDVLVGIDQFGTWYALSNNGFGNVFTAENVGRYNLGDRSSGDVFFIKDVGTFASIKRSGEPHDLIMSLDPRRIFLGDDLMVLEGYSAVYGLAGWRGLLFAFDETGAIIRINLQTLAFDVLDNEGLAWWGAGVSSVIYTVMED